jgi:L-lactate dehydrogenase
MHAQALVGTTEVRAGSYAELEDCQLIVLTAGSDGQGGKNRFEGLQANANLYKDITRQLDKYAPGAILIVAANPVDCITYVIQKYSHRAKHLIIGTGTLLDTARFKALLGAYYNVDPRSIYAFILGEHGDSEVPIWSHVAIGGQLIVNRTILGKPYNKTELNEIFYASRSAGHTVRDLKGYTDKAIGMVVAYLVDAILSDQRSILPVSTDVQNQYGILDVVLSIPCVIGAGGILEKLFPPLEGTELQAMQKSAEVIRAQLDSVDLE